jgi:hypothetical protein
MSTLETFNPPIDESLRLTGTGAFWFFVHGPTIDLPKKPMEWDTTEYPRWTRYEDVNLKEIEEETQKRAREEKRTKKTVVREHPEAR